MGPWEGSQISESRVPTSKYVKSAGLVPPSPRPLATHNRFGIPRPCMIPTSVPLKIALLSPTRLPALGPGGAPSTGPRPASSTPKTHGSLRHTAGTGELRRQRPVLSLSSWLRSIPPLQQPTTVENNTAGADPSARFPRILPRLLMLTNQLAGPAPDAPSGVVVYARAAVAAVVLSPGNCSLRLLSPRAGFVIEGGQGHFASSTLLLLEPGPH